ncbi:LysR family transcriptional regulator [Aliivibrio fischeri]|uniref:LysR family transcriptional regulator n=1 Tax=Aliivibrio fischeri TaxID=668 RepID=UPI0018C6A680|nr:LysR family transcriptional regulator [Aliivibrio fischeri]
MATFTFDQLEAFATVVEQGSFSAAARKLKKDRSTVHQLVAFLEIDWGVELFNREGKTPKLSPDATRLYKYATLLLEQRLEVQNIANNIGSDIEDSLTISYDETMPMSVLVKTEQELSNAFPYTRVNYLSQQKDLAIQSIQDGKVDLTLQLISYRSKPHEGLAGINIGSIHFGVYVSVNSELLDHEPCSFQLMQTKKQLILQSLLSAELDNVAIFSANYQVLTRIDFLISCLEASQLAWSILPIHLAEPYVKSNQIKRCDVAFFDGDISWGCGLISSQNSDKGPVFLKAAECFKKAMKESHHY